MPALYAGFIDIPGAMYKKGVAVEIQFSPERLNDRAGDPYWIDLPRPKRNACWKTCKRISPRAAGARPRRWSSASTRRLSRKPWANAAPTPEPAVSADDFKQWVCVICGWVYDEAAGLPEEGIEPGTRWADVPVDWRCPLCDVGKEDFALVEF